MLPATSCISARRAALLSHTTRRSAYRSIIIFSLDQFRRLSARRLFSVTGGLGSISALISVGGRFSVALAARPLNVQSSFFEACNCLLHDLRKLWSHQGNVTSN